MRVARRSLTWAPLALGVLGYALFAVYSGGDDFARALTRFTGITLTAILGLSLLNYALRFARWHLYLRTLGHSLPWAAGFLYYIAGFAFTTTPGKMGEAVRAIYLKRHDVPYPHSLATLFVERLFDLVAMLALATFALKQFPDAGTIVGIALVVIAVLFLFFARSHVVLPWLARTLPRRIARRLMRRLRDLRALLASAARLLEPRAMLGGFVLAMLAWGAEGLSLYFILQVLGAPLGMPTAVSIYAVSVLVGALSFLPGGLGSTEAAMALLLVLAGVDHATATAATLICRLATLWFAVAIGALAMFVSGSRRPVPQGDVG